MPLAKDLEDYLKSQIDYYVEEAASYKQIAEGYVPEIDSVTDTAFGIITGCTYLAACRRLSHEEYHRPLMMWPRIIKNTYCGKRYPGA